jgi:hypothetical protein
MKPAAIFCSIWSRTTEAGLKVVQSYDHVHAEQQQQQQQRQSS